MIREESVKNDFEYWYTTDKYWLPLDSDNFDRGFYDCRLSMQFGVYQEFFIESGIVIDILPVMNHNQKGYTEIKIWMVCITILNQRHVERWSEYKSLNEARKGALKVSSKLYKDYEL